MKFKTLASLALAFSTSISFAQTGKMYQLKSPDSHINLNVNVGKFINWSVEHDETEVIMPSSISITLANGEIMGKNAEIKNAKTFTEDQFINTPIYKKDKVHNNYNQLILNFKGDYGLIFRAYNDGVAYRFFTQKKDNITVVNEEANFNFKEDDEAFLPFVNDYRNKDKFTTSFEAHYNNMRLSALTTDSMAFLPVLVDVGAEKKAVILEADLQDYPGMYLTSGGQKNLQGIFAKYPTVETTGGYHNINYVVNGRADYIAKTKGTRSFPWRVVVISSGDKQLADNDMMQKLSPSPEADYSWVKPGKVAWDWWNEWNISHIDFKAGINVPTYKYYIDFAAANKLEYIIIDEGWSDDNDLNKFKLDVQQIVDYGKLKNVGVILWSTWYALHIHTGEQFSKFAKIGVKGFKIDFIDRDDQKMVSSLYAIAKAAAANHLLVDFHGMYKPSGLQRTYPNVINFEGVKGLENMKWGTTDQPGYDVSIPFIRMVSGPMDYTPGGMRNATKEGFRAVNSNPMTQGTRCHQLAMYTIFEAPLQMLADNPTTYHREQECTDYISSVPTTFDQTEALGGKVGDFVSIARRKGTTWYAGAMTNWDSRNITVDLSFLSEGSYRAVLFEDGLNAGKDATDYKKNIITVSAKDKLTIKMASGGGWAARFEKIK
ncbi:glycoside hydrolase family 97 protein [Mucilaginibacter sp. X4EP1]|uniref:glycoside hydrolase family 97 protein n=1 Tax=Mucilaginibacter sp. X4EP1 TaxID=2723092 RepID=UPI002166E511|nr:glycoside hydrolase family 97 protein [Mucilaginibacter sp. X4EP1]MCS3812662.1 alpha-glucosidase [Mucilaginibacter sp. X4EP1]